MALPENKNAGLTCSVEGCAFKPISKSQRLCTAHWNLLPSALRRILTMLRDMKYPGYEEALANALLQSRHASKHRVNAMHERLSMMAKHRKHTDG